MICGIMIVSCGGRGGSNSGGGGNDGSVPASETRSTPKSEEDKMLDELEKFADEYIDVLKKVATGDVAAALLVQDKAKHFEELMQKISLVHDAGKLSEAQIERGTKIGEKIAAAFQ